MKKILTILAAVAVLFLSKTPTASAVVRTTTVEYTHGETTLVGYLAYDDSIKGERPGVLVIHEWWGLNDYIKRRARMLAELGYVAFAVDMYGNGVKTTDSKEAGRLAGIYRANRSLMRERAGTGLEVLRNYRLTDRDRIAAIGYCFGGSTVLELARSGADILGVVSFHGNLDTPDPDEAKNIKARILALHGGDDPYVKPDDVLAFQNEMRRAGVDWQFIAYGGAVHSFTNPASGSNPSKGVAYNELADKRSWKAMRMFFKEIFGE